MSTEQNTNYCIQLVDDHHMLRMGLIALAQTSDRLNIQWLESNNLCEAMDSYRSQGNIDLVLLDLNLPDSQGLQGLQRFLNEFPNARIAIFSATEDEFVVRQALALGAAGFVPKSASAATTLHLIETLLLSIRPALSNAPNVIQAKLIKTKLSPLTDALNPTQLKVLELVLAGMSNQEIATSCKLALGTVKNTVSSTMLAMDVRSRSHLISMFR
ncbi:MAG: response regulator transcription factor [Burkholderiaceae bacterium]